MSEHLNQGIFEKRSLNFFGMMLSPFPIKMRGARTHKNDPAETNCVTPAPFERASQKAAPKHAVESANTEKDNLAQSLVLSDAEKGWLVGTDCRFRFTFRR